VGVDIIPSLIRTAGINRDAILELLERCRLYLKSFILLQAKRLHYQSRPGSMRSVNFAILGLITHNRAAGGCFMSWKPRVEVWDLALWGGVLEERGVNAAVRHHGGSDRRAIVPAHPRLVPRLDGRH
jgi:hypothetical protein